jgi:hypothetical protein
MADIGGEANLDPWNATFTSSVVYVRMPTPPLPPMTSTAPAGKRASLVAKLVAKLMSGLMVRLLRRG